MFGKNQTSFIQTLMKQPNCNTAQRNSTKRGNYNIKVKAKDEHGAESGWGSLSVSMPKNKDVQYQLLQKFLDIFSNIIELIRQNLFV